mgnify:FL=1
MVPEVYAQNKNEKKMQIGICIVKSDVGGKQQTGIAFCGKGGIFCFTYLTRGWTARPSAILFHRSEDR